MNAEKQFQVIHSHVRQRSVKKAIPYIADFRQTAVAQARMVEGIRAGGVAQRYVVRGRLKASDDGSIVDVENHFFNAEAGKKNTANSVLRTQHSGVKLESEGDFKYRGKDYEKLTAKYSGRSGDDMSITSDCGGCCREVIGNASPYARFLSPGFPDIYRTRSEDDPEDLKTEICSKIRHTARSIRREQVRAITEESGLLKSIWEVGGRVEHRTDLLAGFTDEQLHQVLDESSTLSALYGVNKAANPGVGGGYTISSGGADYPGEATWNFHWAGIVMESNDRKDKVSLENYAVPDGHGGNVVNKEWNFDMYGTEKRGQSFHERHKATEQHGQTPTTMSVK